MFGDGTGANWNRAFPPNWPTRASLAFLKVAPVVLNKEKFNPPLVMTELQGSARGPNCGLECFTVSNRSISGSGARSRPGDPNKFVVPQLHHHHVRPRERRNAPADAADDSQSVNVKNRVGLLEGAVITWTKQIKAVLKQDPERARRTKDPTRTSSSRLAPQGQQPERHLDQQSPRIRRVLEPGPSEVAAVHLQ